MRKRLSCNPNGITLIETVVSIGCIGFSLGMLRSASSLASAGEAEALPGILTLSAFFLLGAVLGNTAAIFMLGREYAVEGVILGGALLAFPLTLTYLQFC